MVLNPIFIYVTSRVSYWTLLSSSPKAAGWCALSSGWPFSGGVWRLGEVAAPFGGGGGGGLQIIVLVDEAQNGEGRRLVFLPDIEVGWGP